MLSPDTTTGAFFGSTAKSVKVSVNDCADADCSSREVAAKGVLTPAATTRIVAAKKRKVVVALLAVSLELFSVLGCFISVPSTNIIDKRFSPTTLDSYILLQEDSAGTICMVPASLKPMQMLLLVLRVSLTDE